ncbi:MAG TPA: glycosyltransferase family 87 protein [Terracidiphilus sp.]
MTRARADGRFFLVLGIVILVLFGTFLVYRATDSMVDFKELYYGARTLLQHSDPYNQKTFSDLLRTEFGEGRFVEHHAPTAISINLPTTYFLVVPLAMLPYWLAAAIWSILTAASLIAAACLVWKIGASYAPVLSGAFAGFALVNGAVVIGNGNSAGVIVGLCAIAVWCFVSERLVWLGILCFGISLVVKPQDAGLLWLFFLLVGGVFRRRALQALALVVLFSLPAVLWVSRSAPQWMPELHSNLVQISARGGNCDPGPDGLTSKTATMEVITDLQAVISVFHDSPSFYNPATFLICGVLLLAWSIATMKSGFSPHLAWLALAAIAPLTLLVTYHRAYDARLLLLTIPACAMLWAKGGSVGKAALGLNSAALVFTGEVPLAFINPFVKNVLAGAPGTLGKFETILLMRLGVLSLLGLCLFYLWIYLREQHASAPMPQPAAAQREPAPVEGP